MVVLIAVVAINLVVWVALVCAARWQGRSDPVSAVDLNIAAQAGRVSAEGR